MKSIVRSLELSLVVLLAAGQLSPQPTVTEDRRVVELLNTLYSLSPDVRAFVGTTLLGKASTDKTRAEILRALEGISTKLKIAAPFDLIAGYRTDRPTGFLANAATLSLTRVDVELAIAEYNLKRDSQTARSIVSSLIPYVRQQNGCESLAMIRPERFVRFLPTFFKFAFTAEEKKKSEDFHYAESLIVQAGGSELLTVLLGSIKDWGFSSEQQRHLYEVWSATFSNATLENRPLLEVWVFRPIGKDALNQALRAGAPNGTMIAIAKKLSAQLLLPVCRDQIPENAKQSIVDRVLGRKSSVTSLSWLTDLTATEGQPIDFYWHNNSGPEGKELLYWSSPEFQKLFLNARKLNHDPRLSLNANSADTEAATAEAIDLCLSAARIKSSSTDDAPRTYVQQLHLVSLILARLPSNHPSKLRLLDLSLPIASQALANSDSGPIAVFQLWQLLRKMRDGNIGDNTLVKFSQVSDANIRSLVLLSALSFPKQP